MCHTGGLLRRASLVVHSETNGLEARSSLLISRLSPSPKTATACEPAQSPRVPHNRDRELDSKPHIALALSSSVEWKMGGLPHEQYRVHSSEKPALRGIRYDPLRYGLKPTRYRVRHFGRSTQCERVVSWTHINQARFVDQPKLDVGGPCSQEKRAGIFLPTLFERSSCFDFSGPYGFGGCCHGPICAYCSSCV